MELTENMVNQPGKEILFAHYASNLLKSGELDEAIKICEFGLKKFPTYAQAHYILARCYIRKKLNDEARAELERVLRYEPSHIKAIRDLAGLHFANGFQDLYKEYLMQLFTLEPMNHKVIDEVKKLGEYKLWTADTQAAPEPETEAATATDSETYDDDKEDLFLESDKEKIEQSESDPIFPDKIDLSQFDNVEDDFTTILHGKSEYSRQFSESEPQSSPDLADIAKDIIEEPTPEEKVDTPGQEEKISKSAEMPEVNNDVAGESQKETSLDEAKSSALKESANNKISENNLSDDTEKVASPLHQDLAKERELDDEVSNVDDFSDEEDDKFEQPKIISQTLGEILVSQQKYAEAKAVFEALKEKQPDNKALDLKIEYLDRIIGLENEGKS